MTLPLEKQVVSLDLAKRMKELGAPQVSYFYRLEPNGPFHVPCTMIQKHDDVISAYTVAELGEILPRYVDTKKGYQDRQPYWICKMGTHEERADTEADARAALYVYLKEHNLL